MEHEPTISCANCGQFYVNGDAPPCRLCSCTARVFSKKMTGSITPSAGVRGKHLRPGYEKPIFEFIRRRKLGGASGRPAREALSFDRTRDSVTVKTHRVEEKRDDATWEVVHDEQIKYPAKRRPARGSP